MLLSMKITLQNLLRLQFSFYIFAISYLLVSYIAILNGEKALSTADPINSGIILSLYCLSLLTAFLKEHKVYRTFMAISIIIFGYGGVIHHFINYYNSGLEEYSSFMSWSIAIIINSYGVFFNIVAVCGKYKR